MDNDSTSSVRMLMRRDKAALGAALFCAGVAVYGAFGVPTPSEVGFLERTIAILFLLSALALGVWNVFLQKPQAPWFSAGRWLLVFGLSVPLAIGFSFAHDKGGIVRDLIAFDFMMMPVIFFSLSAHARIVFRVTLALGVLFTLRSIPGFDLGMLGASEKLDYLENMPSILMAALFFGGSAIAVICERFNLRAVAVAAIFTMLAALCLMPLVLTQQRASVGVFALGLIVVLITYLWRAPRRAFWLIAIGAGLLGFYARAAGQIYDDLIAKSMLVGANMRFEELAAVWAQISRNAGTFIFGLGWGAHYPSPAVAGISVNYTHSLLSALMLKTGMSGLILGATYLVFIFRALFQNMRGQVVILMALSGPLMIDIFLYASYKSLDFGLVLCMAAWLGMKGESEGEKIASDVPIMYSEL